MNRNQTHVFRQLVKLQHDGIYTIIRMYLPLYDNGQFLKWYMRKIVPFWQIESWAPNSSISRNIARKIVISYTHLLAGSRKSSQGTEIFIIVQVMSQSQKVCGGVRIFVKRTKFRNANYFDF